MSDAMMWFTWFTSDSYKTSKQTRLENSYFSRDHRNNRKLGGHLHVPVVYIVGTETHMPSIV